MMESETKFLLWVLFGFLALGIVSYAVSRIKKSELYIKIKQEINNYLAIIYTVAGFSFFILFFPYGEVSYYHIIMGIEDWSLNITNVMLIILGGALLAPIVWSLPSAWIVTKIRGKIIFLLFVIPGLLLVYVLGYLSHWQGQVIALEAVVTLFMMFGAYFAKRDRKEKGLTHADEVDIS